MLLVFCACRRTWISPSALACLFLLYNATPKRQEWNEVRCKLTLQDALESWAQLVPESSMAGTCGR